MADTTNNETPTFRLDEDGEHVWFGHDCLAGMESEVMLPLGPPFGWIVTRRAPLSVSPSVHCLNCGTHGFITDGEWVPA